MVLKVLPLLPFFLLGVIASGPLATRQSSDCGLPLPTGFTRGQLSQLQTISGNREYKVFVPPSYDEEERTPLILSYHGANGNIASQAALDNITDPFFERNHIVVYLQGLVFGDDPEHTTWEGAPGNEADDIGFTAAVLDRLETQLCVDQMRIYATGKSQGGGFVNRLACDPTLSTRIAAFAPVSGAYYIKEIETMEECFPTNQINLDEFCHPGRNNVPILAFHGGMDTTINITGGWRSETCLPDVFHWIQSWAQRDGLDVDQVTQTPIQGSDNGTRYRWGGGLVSFVYDGDDIGHVWPATVTNSDNAANNLATGRVKAAFNATSWILDFFGEHVLE